MYHPANSPSALFEWVKNLDYLALFRRWWLSLVLIPFVVYHLHQAYWSLRFNIFFSYNYDFPFPINIENLLVRNFLLIVHEAGHTLMGFFGNRTLTILGGSLYEILLPVIILSYFLTTKAINATQLGFYLAGSAWVSVAFYAADAGGRQLPLIGNLGNESHDWGNLLTSWNLLHYDSAVGIALALVGAACYLAALSVPWWMESYDIAEIDLDI